MQIKKRKLRHHRKTSLDDALCWPRFSQNVLVSELFVNHLAWLGGFFSLSFWRKIAPPRFFFADSFNDATVYGERDLNVWGKSSSLLHFEPTLELSSWCHHYKVNTKKSFHPPQRGSSQLHAAISIIGCGESFFLFLFKRKDEEEEETSRPFILLWWCLSVSNDEQLRPLECYAINALAVMMVERLLLPITFHFQWQTMTERCLKYPE